MSNRLPVLFLEGTGRTGSTVLSNLLGSVPGAASFGEVRHVWRRGLLENWDCGCGASFAACDFWRSVLERAFGSRDQIDIATLLESERALFRLRASPRALRWSRQPSTIRRTHEYFLWATRRLYLALAEVSRAEMLVDSSKTPTYGAVLGTMEEIDLRVIHLVRDPRATAYSWMNPKASPERGSGGAMDRIGPAKAALLWAWWNRLADELSKARPAIPRLRVSYEDLMSAPETTLRATLEQLAPELQGKPLPISGEMARLGISHTVSGNPARMRRGAVTLELDDRWRDGLDLRSETLVEFVGGPVMRRYGYERRNRETA